MRTSPLREQLASKGASFQVRHGQEVVERFADEATEYRRVRDAVGVTDFSFMHSYRLPEETGVDFLDSLVAGNVARIRFGRVLHTFLADDDGSILADCYLANNDDELLLLCESTVGDEAMARILREAGGDEAGLVDLTSDHVVIGVDGFRAWDVMKTVFGADVLGLPYLSTELYPFESGQVVLFRAGKTSEFGYLVLAERAVAGPLLDRLVALAEEREGGLCGVAVHDTLRLEGRFFNLHREGVEVRDPLTLGLQWMIDFDKGAYAGSSAIAARRAAGLQRKIIGVRAPSGNDDLRTGASICTEEGPVAEVVNDCYSPLLECRLGLAVFPVDLAFAGLPFYLGAPGGPEVHSISMPPIMPKSLTVKLD